MGGYLSRVGPNIVENGSTEQNKSDNTANLKIDEDKNIEDKKVEEFKDSEKTIPPTPNSTPVLTSEKVDSVFKEIIHESGTKVEVLPVDVSPAADVVKKGKKKNKNKNSN